VEYKGASVPGDIAVAGAEGAALGLMKLASIRWVAAWRTIELFKSLAPAAAGAGVAWLLVKPWGDDEITQSWNAWLTASSKLGATRVHGDWTDRLTAIQKAWPEGADRKAFDRFMGIVWEEMFQTEQATLALGSAVQKAQTQIEQMMHIVGLIADTLLAIIIASEFFELVNPAAAVAMRTATTGVLMGVTTSAVTILPVILVYNLGNLSGMLSNGAGFPQPQPNRFSSSLDSDTDFKDIKVQNRRHKGGWTYQ
jgi:hypothetical protein